MGFFVFVPTLQEAYSSEENFLTLETGIISTLDRDFAVSNEFQTKIFQDGKIMRITGVTTTGEPYYIYQKNIGEEVILRGKILLDGKFVSIIQKETVPLEPVSQESEGTQESEVTQEDTQLIMATKIPHHTYARYPMIISVKVFDAEQNPLGRFEQKSGVLENVFVDVSITNEFGKVVTTLNGTTNSLGIFSASHYVREGIDLPGQYTVDVAIDDQSSRISEAYTTFFRGDIRDYWENR